MSEPFEEIANVDRLVHEPARLAILVVLGACVHADFTHLQAITGLSKGNLSLHLSKLEAGGLIAIEKTFRWRKPRTVAALTKDGKAAIREYWRRIDEARKAARKVARERHPWTFWIRRREEK